MIYIIYIIKFNSKDSYTKFVAIYPLPSIVLIVNVYKVFVVRNFNNLSLDFSSKLDNIVTFPPRTTPYLKYEYILLRVLSIIIEIPPYKSSIILKNKVDMPSISISQNEAP
jgi:hypothetical protein